MYVFFALSLIGSQELDKDPYTFIPIFLILKFIFFFGWLEVAEAIENPFGNDDDDFQICELVSRHLWVILEFSCVTENPKSKSFILGY